MLLYNITFKVDPSIFAGWLTWMQAKYIPGIQGCGCFLRCQLLRLLDVDDSDGPTFALQCYAADRAAYEHYQETCAIPEHREITRLWGAHCLNFRTLMEVVQ